MSGESSRQSDRAAVQRVVDRIVREPVFRQELLDDPHRALRLLGIDEEGEGPEVTGHMMPVGACGCSNNLSCTKTCGAAGGSTCTMTCKKTTGKAY